MTNPHYIHNEDFNHLTMEDQINLKKYYSLVDLAEKLSKVEDKFDKDIDILKQMIQSLYEKIKRVEAKVIITRNAL